MIVGRTDQPSYRLPVSFNRNNERLDFHLLFETIVQSNKLDPLQFGSRFCAELVRKNQNVKTLESNVLVLDATIMRYTIPNSKPLHGSK